MALYRSHLKSLLSDSTNTFVNPYVNSPRRPLTTPIKTHEIWGNWFQSAFGDNYRERAIFCTGNINQAKSYMSDKHELVEISPIGEYKICFSPRIYDLFEHFFSGNFSGEPNSEDDVIKELRSVGYLKFENCGIESAIEAKCEVMIIASSFNYKLIGNHEFK